jgi:hypothetical protein
MLRDSAVQVGIALTESNGHGYVELSELAARNLRVLLKNSREQVRGPCSNRGDGIYLMLIAVKLRKNRQAPYSVGVCRTRVQPSIGVCQHPLKNIGFSDDLVRKRRQTRAS